MRAPNSLFFAQTETLLSARCWLIDRAVAYVHKYTYACTLLLVVISQELRKGLVRDRDPPITPTFTRDLPMLLALITGTTTTTTTALQMR